MPGNLPATRDSTAIEGRVVPKTEYVYVQDVDTGPSPNPGRQWSVKWAPKAKPNTPTPKHVPRMMGNQRVIAYAWVVSMIVVAVDEWKRNGILPRPARLWDTSIVFGLLALVSVVDAMVPLCNALAIGYAIMLIWQYFNKSGQFS